MTRSKPRNIPLAELVRAADEAARDGRFDVARGLVEDAMAKSPRDPALRELGCRIAVAAADITTAIADASRWLALAPADLNAAQALTRLADAYRIEDVADLDARGLQIAVRTGGGSRAGVARLALARAIHGDRDMAAVLAAAPGDTEAVGRSMASTRPLPKALASELFRCGLAAHVLGDHRLERLLTGFRAGLLLDAGPSALTDPERFEMALAMLEQVWLGDHAWAETPAEQTAVAALAVDTAAAADGDVVAACALLLTLLYRPLQQVIGGPSSTMDASRLRPKSFGKALSARLAADSTEAAFAAAIPTLVPVADPTSRAVQAQYEAAPYPRWSSITMPAPGSLLRYLKGLPGVGDATILDKPFRVLIAGAGTGQQAVRSAIGYGEAATVTALDLSRRSLGYAGRMAREAGVTTIDWRQGDLLDIGEAGDRYEVIECVGVLHHMADPFEGWRRLLGVLAPGGLMLVGLYSRTARRAVTALRLDPASPGPGCSDAAARAWRRTLLDRTADDPAASVRVSRNFNAHSEFRDLVLHTSERAFDVDEIEAFLEAEGLRFLGFMLPPPVLSAFAARFPTPGLPGRLGDWAAFEADTPSTFEAMYCFWVTRH